MFNVNQQPPFIRCYSLVAEHGAASCVRFSHDCTLSTLTNEFPSGGQHAHGDYQIFCRAHPKQALDEFITMSKIVLVPENKKAVSGFCVLDIGFIEG